MSIKSKVLGAILLANGATIVIVLLFFLHTGNLIINKNVDIQSKEVEGNIKRNFKQIIDGIDHMNYLLITDNQNILAQAAQQPEIKIDTFESVMLQRSLEEKVGNLYGFQKYLDSYSIYSKENLLMTKGTKDQRVDKTFLNVIQLTEESLPKEIADIPLIIRPIKFGNRQTVQAVATINLDYFLLEQFSMLPKGSKIEAYNTAGIRIDNVDNGHSREQETITRIINAPGSAMRIKVTLPVDTFRGTLAESLRRAIIVCLIVMVLTTLIVLITVLKITKNIGVLNHAMNRVRAKKLDTKVVIDSSDELQTMGIVFNSMVDNINELMIENHAKDQEKKTIEMDFLQSQINPHFLSNTLNSIVWMAELQEADNIVNLTKALITLLHASMYKGEDMISLENELAHVQSYVAIQQVAYMNNFEISYEIPEALMQVQILRFVLQPLVENSILHNFVHGGRSGKIVLSAKRIANRIELEVFDNGYGIENEQLDSGRENKRYSKIGVANIDKRIKLYFGEAYGLSYETERNKYTKAIITIPYCGFKQERRKE